MTAHVGSIVASTCRPKISSFYHLWVSSFSSQADERVQPNFHDAVKTAPELGNRSDPVTVVGTGNRAVVDFQVPREWSLQNILR